MKNKEHNGQEQNEGQDGMPALWYALSHCKKASQMYVRPFCGAD